MSGLNADLLRDRYAPAMLKRKIAKLVSRSGYRLDRSTPGDADEFDRSLWTAVKPYTMTPIERVMACRSAVEHVERHQIPGAVVECGVWRGGMMLAAAMTLDRCGARDRDLWLYDTFQGMVRPGANDVKADGTTAASIYQTKGGRTDGAGSEWAAASIGDVRSTMALSSYPADKIHYVEGLVEQTIPTDAPDVIAILRLDTDWYDSTRHELAHLAKRVSRGGLIMIDDYGDWQGAKKAVDEWMATEERPLYLSRTDRGSRLIVMI